MRRTGTGSGAGWLVPLSTAVWKATVFSRSANITVCSAAPPPYMFPSKTTECVAMDRMDPDRAAAFAEDLLDEEKLKDMTAADGTLPGGAHM